MKSLIKKSLTALIAGAALTASACAADTPVSHEGWMEDLEQAFAKAKKEDKPVLAEFTGSDWCPPCKMMHKKVFSKKDFIKKASEKYILVVIDIPNGNPEMKAKNKPILKKYKVKGVPTVILFDKDGTEFDRFTASKYPSVDLFLKHLDKALEKKDMQ